MRVRTASLLALALTGLAACEPAPSTAPAETTTPPPVSFQEAASAGDVVAPSQHLIFVKSRSRGDVADAVVDLGGQVLFQHEVGFVFASGLDDAAVVILGAMKDVETVTADESYALGSELTGEPMEATIASPENPAGAFFFARQWHHRVIGADQAWAVGRLGSADVTVAILDTGIDYTNLDLQGRVDLARSVSFVPVDDQLTQIYFPGRHPISDLHYHGTHVAATAVSNGIVGAGVTSGATLMGVKVCTVVDQSCSFGAVMSGVLYAADNGADVVNMSLGGGFAKAGLGQFVGFINRVFNHARQQGATVVVAAGNAAADLDHNGNVFATYCDAPGVICVSATGPTASGGTNGPWQDVDALAYYSNFGRSAISVAAPGGNTGGSVWATCTRTSLVVPICQTGNYIIGIGGTSMATPHVSGLAALVVEDVGPRPSQVKARIQQGAQDLGQPGTDPAYGKGRIHVGNTLGLN